jgi:hypothetical protein
MRFHAQCKPGNPSSSFLMEAAQATFTGGSMVDIRSIRARHPLTTALQAVLAIGGVLWLLAFAWMFSATFLELSHPAYFGDSFDPSEGLKIKLGALAVMGLLGPAVLVSAWWRHRLWTPAMWRPVRSRA